MSGHRFQNDKYITINSNGEVCLFDQNGNEVLNLDKAAQAIAEMQKLLTALTQVTEAQP